MKARWVFILASARYAVCIGNMRKYVLVITAGRTKSNKTKVLAFAASVNTSSRLGKGKMYTFIHLAKRNAV